MLHNDDKRVVIYWIAKSLNEKARQFVLIRNKLQQDSDINAYRVITDYQETSEHAKLLKP